MQIGFGASGAAALAAETYTDFTFHPLAAGVTGDPLPIRTRRVDNGTKVWVRVLAKGQNTGTMDFYFAMHPYEG
jgi:hypothetical protein